MRNPFTLKTLLVFVAVLALYFHFAGADQFFALLGSNSANAQSLSSSADAIRDAFSQRKSGVQVAGKGVVIKLLADDNDGSRHQRFILRLSSGQTLLIAHNIDLAPRIPALKMGDTVSFYGEYEWNSQGGVVHWTHKDPQGRHLAGWLEHLGKTYQ